jgi:protein-tyrosine phosphatase
MEEIIEHLYLGSMVDGRDATIDSLCVMWYGEPGINPESKHIVTTWYHDKGIGVRPNAMDEAADYIHEHLSVDNPLLVYCAVGMERSPLTIAWYLRKYHSMTFAEAYTLMHAKRSIVENREHWLKVALP